MLVDIDRLTQRGETFRARNGETLDRETGRFIVGYLDQHPRAAENPRMRSLFHELTTGAQWGALILLDGPAADDIQEPSALPATPEKYEEARTKAREWTAQNFNHYELGKLGDLIIEHALTPAVTEGAPGYLRGYGDLLRHMVDKPGSIFADRVSAGERKILANGAFWEEVGCATALDRLHDVLEDHGTELDPDLTPQGLKLYNRNRQHDPDSGWRLRFGDFSKEALEAYLRFMTGLDQKAVDLKIDQKTVDGLIRPYVLAILAPDEDDPGLLRFGPHYDEERDAEVTPTQNVKVRMHDPLVQTSLARSLRTQKAVAERINDIITDNEGDNALGIYALEAIGGETGDKILEMVVKKAHESPNDLGMLLSLLQGPSTPIKEKALAIVNAQLNPQQEEE